MKKLITLLVVSGAIFGMSAVSMGQQSGAKTGGAKQGQKGQKGQRQGAGRQARMAKMQDEIFAKLNLTADQKTKIEAHQKKAAEKFKTLAEEARKSGDREKSQEKFKAFRDENEKALKGILTAEQWTKFDAARDEMRKKMRKERGQGGQKGGGAKGGGK